MNADAARIEPGQLARDPFADPKAQRLLRDIQSVLALGPESDETAELVLAPSLADIVHGIRQVLTIKELAEAAGVRERQAHHWAAGKHFPNGETRTRLLRLHAIVGELCIFLGSERAKVWLFSPHQSFDDETPFERLVRGEGESVLEAARMLPRLPVSSNQPWVDDGYLIALAKHGHADAYDRIVRRYYGFVRMKASAYYLAGGDADDLIQEGLVGLYKAVRDYRSDQESSFRNFAELCITRQIVIAVTTATRNTHSSLNQYVSVPSTPAGEAGDGEPTLDELLPGSPVHDPVNQVISSEELRALVACISTALSELESRVLALYLDGHSYEEIGRRLDCDSKTVDNALQRVKRKVGQHLVERSAPA